MVALAHALAPSPSPAALVDLERWPIADLDTPTARAVVATARRALETTGLCLLPGFLTKPARRAMAAEVEARVGHAHPRDAWFGLGTGYRGANASADGRSSRYAMRALACDRLDPTGPLRALFGWDGLTDLVSALVGERLYPSVDPLASLSVTILGAGDEHGWHYDENDFVVSLLLQDADDGGHFELVPGSRDRTDARAVEDRALAGEAGGLVRPTVGAGTLSLLRGRRSLHHVSPVERGRRLIALFSYDRRPGMVFSDGVRSGAFGRVA
ncbi:MAG: 2OG-Fe(II) oxygenase [Alphaproteobacteria bacterium]|nr:2OG-Fe(II) oxygenase [Alphaproteobacteria bacterium]